MKNCEKSILPPEPVRRKPALEDVRPGERRPKLGLFGPRPDQAGTLGARELKRIVATVIG
jgi:hypothetical protein